MIRTPFTERIAVLDDDIKFIRLVERILLTEQIDVQPVTTMDLDEAVAVVAATGCIAAIVDVYMYGDAAGFRLVEKLREDARTATLPIIVSSAAHREVGKHIPFLLKNNCTVLLKPFGIEDLISKVRAIRNPQPVPMAVPVAFTPTRIH